MADLLELVTAIRNVRADAGIEPGTWLQAEVRLRRCAGGGRLRGPAGCRGEAGPGATGQPSRASPTEPDEAALVVVSRGAEARLSVSAEDRERDLERLRKELADTERLLASTRTKLANESFLSRAPSDVVAGVRDTEAELEARATRLREHLEP